MAKKDKTTSTEASRNEPSSQPSGMMGKFKGKLAEKAKFKKEQSDLRKSRERALDYLLKEDQKRRESPSLPPEEAFLSLRHVNKVYPNLVQAVYDFNLDIKKNEFIVFVGPSGCGKSTTLRMIAGLEDITTGDLFLSGKLANNVPAKERDMAMVFQSYALYPHLNVYQNMAFSLKLRHEKKETIYERVKTAAKILELGEYLDRKPKELSGGQRQRVALGRAIVRNASIFLMDEPLSNLDAKLRVQMRSEIVKLHKALGATTIYVTHDQTEAMTMADRIVVMKLGHIQQIGTPEEIFDHPANMFVASFIGSPAMNLIEASYDEKSFHFGDADLPISQKQLSSIADFYQKRKSELAERLQKETERVDRDLEKLQSKKKRKVDLTYLYREKESVEKDIAKLDAFLAKEKKTVVYGIRPEDFSRADGSGANVLSVKVKVAELMGREYIIYFDLGGKQTVARIDASKPVSAGDELKIKVDLSKSRLYDPVSELAIN